jgi:hypothetical protein
MNIKNSLQKLPTWAGLLVSIGTVFLLSLLLVYIVLYFGFSMTDGD